jgi:tRNA1(Val) A37 N6-methylase TrmN6
MELKKRRRLGRYDTPPILSQALVDWAVRNPTDKVLEPSSGAGGVVASAIRRLKILGQRHPQRKVWACDIDSTACAQTARYNGLHQTHIWSADFLSLIDCNGVVGRKFDCIVGNPPYVSLHRMRIGQRKRAIAMAKRIGFAIDKRSSLWAYFVAACTEALLSKGRLALILPESILHVDYARELLQTMGRRFTHCLLLSIRERCFVTNGAAERVVLFLGEDFQPTAAESEILLQECITAQEAVQFLKTLKPSTAKALPKLNGHAVPHLLLETLDMVINFEQFPDSRLFGDFVEIKIGVVTGANKFFLLTENERKKWKFPLSAVKPLIPRFQVCKGLVFRQSDWEILRDTGKKCWLFSPSGVRRDAVIAQYVRQFPKADREANRTFSKRSPWYSPQLGEIPDAFFRYMGSFGPRLALARCDATCTNTVHRVFFKDAVSALQQKIITLSLHSSFSRLSAEFEGRAYGSGVLKLEPSEAKRLRLLLPTDLNVELVHKCFAKAEEKMIAEKTEEATAEIDSWLYSCMPEMSKILPLPNLRRLLSASVERRVGYPQKVKSEGDCRSN